MKYRLLGNNDYFWLTNCGRRTPYMMTYCSNC